MYLVAAAAVAAIVCKHDNATSALLDVDDCFSISNLVQWANTFWLLPTIRIESDVCPDLHEASHTDTMKACM